MSPRTTLEGPDLTALRSALIPTEYDLWRARPLAHPLPFDDTGSRTKRPGRYHVTGLFGAIYFATTFDGALLEFVSRQEHQPVSALLHHERVRIEKTLDLTAIDVRRALVPWGQALEAEAVTLWQDFSVPNGIAALSLGLGADGLIAPSAAFHRAALSRVGVTYQAGGVTSQLEEFDEFLVVVVLHSAVHAPLRDPVQVDAIARWSS